MDEIQKIKDELDIPDIEYAKDVLAALRIVLGELADRLENGEINLKLAPHYIRQTAETITSKKDTQT